MGPYEPRMSAERAEWLQLWHDEASATLRALGDHDVDYLGLRLHVPAGVFPPAPMSQLLGRSVITEVREGDRVLDMGTGSGVNAILAAQQGARVTAVDVNPAAVAAAAANAEACGVDDRIELRTSDLFSEVDGRFDVIVFDPPFRWFTPVDMFERAFTDDGYATLARFFAQAGDHLLSGGRLLLFFGTTGDVDYFRALAADHAFAIEAIGSAEFIKEGVVETYWAFRGVRSCAR